MQDWLYKQMLSSSMPLHPLLVNLIDVFVTSVVMPLPSKHRRLAANITVEGFSEADILTVFQNQVWDLELVRVDMCLPIRILGQNILSLN